MTTTTQSQRPHPSDLAWKLRLDPDHQAVDYSRYVVVRWVEQRSSGFAEQEATGLWWRVVSHYKTKRGAENARERCQNSLPTEAAKCVAVLDTEHNAWTDVSRVIQNWTIGFELSPQQRAALEHKLNTRYGVGARVTFTTSLHHSCTVIEPSRDLGAKAWDKVTAYVKGVRDALVSIG